MFGWFGKTRRIKCPDGSTREVYKNPDDAFPLFANNINYSAAAAEMANQIKANVTAEHKSELASVLFGLDDCNKSIQALFRAAYVAYSASPCSNLGFLVDAVVDIKNMEHRYRIATFHLRVVQTLLAGQVAADSEMISRTVYSAVMVLIPNPEKSQEAVTAAFAAIPDNTEAWRR